MTNSYTVHIYREMRLTYEGIEADGPLQAASEAKEGREGNAFEVYEEWQGEAFSALVVAEGDEEDDRSSVIDFEGERQRKSAGIMLKALQMASHYMADDLDESDETEFRVFRTIRAAIVNATETAPTSADRTLTIEVRGGIVQDVSNIPPGGDYQIIDRDNAE